MNDELRAIPDHKPTQRQKKLKHGLFTYWLDIFASCIIVFGLTVTLLTLGIGVSIQFLDAKYSAIGAMTAYCVAGSTFLGILFIGLPLGALAEISKKLSNPK